MTDSLRQIAWRFICAKFPERQIYIRSEGRVQFFTFGPAMQAVIAGTALLVLGWVAFTSVNTIFKDRIIAVKERHFRQVKDSYETRIANLQLSYDDLNRALIVAEDRFKAVADNAESRHRILASLIERKESLETSFGRKSAASSAPRKAAGAKLGDSGVGGSLDLPVPNSAAPSPVQSEPPQLRLQPTSQSHSALSGAAQKLGALFHARRSNAANHPALRNIEASQARLENLTGAENILLADTESAIARETVQYQKAIRTAGIDPKRIVGRVTKASLGKGGPEIARQARDTPKADESFESRAVLAMASLDDLSNVVTALRALPLTAPVLGEQYDESSGFGVRRDPFTDRPSFHSGLDFSGPHGSPVRATAPGIVVFAGHNGAYGNTVEVDHGLGVRTRYGHLSQISVTTGAKVQKGAVVGALGSTGRSTGPHLHYEVWYDTAVKNPSNFLKAGRYVLQAKGT